MMELPEARIGPYLQALQAGLNALAPNADYVPLREGLAHLTTMDPSISGPLLLPAEIHSETGMPAFIWLERALAEQSLALEGNEEHDPTDESIARARQLEPALGDRMFWRRQLHRVLRKAKLLPRTRLDVVIKRLKGETVVTATFDRMDPMGYWVRIRTDLSAAVGQTVMGPVTINDRTHLTIDPGFEHLLTRHSQTPFVALKEALEDVTPVSTITRLARSQVGPFWFPGTTLPAHAPPTLNQGLLLHTSVQILARDVHHSEQADPLLPPIRTHIPKGFGWFQQRRFAASPNIQPTVQQWCADQNVPCAMVTLRP